MTYCIYFASPNVEWPVVKIGYTKNLEQRMNHLAAAPLIAAEDDYWPIRNLERHLHTVYADLRVPDATPLGGRTEWFHFEDQLADDLEDLLRYPDYWPWNIGRRIL